MLIGLVGCGTVNYGNEEAKAPIQNGEVDTSTTKTGKELYTACKGCHGQLGEKEALGKSQLIGGQSYTTTKFQLEEYKAGRLDQYGMGQLMKGQSQLTSNEILLVSKYVETLSIANNFETISGKNLYAVCKGCHGANGKVSALGKSRIIINMKKLDIYNALVGYQNETYGGDMKSLMKGQVKDLSKTDLKDLARYISNL